MNISTVKFEPLINGLIEFFKSFLLISFLVFSLMYLVPGDKTELFRPELAWPLSYFNWLINIITGKAESVSQIWLYYFRTCYLVFGALGLSFLFVVILYVLKQKFDGSITRVIFTIINITSGFHIVVLSLIYYLWIRDVGISFGIFVILAIGNGSLVEFYNTFESELEKIFKKEYVLAGVAWGHSIYRFPRREILITIVEMMVSRLPILFGSTIIVELIFIIRGISAAILSAVKYRYFDTLIISTVLVASTIILFNLIAEKVRWYLDPRVRHASI